MDKTLYVRKLVKRPPPITSAAVREAMWYQPYYTDGKVTTSGYGGSANSNYRNTKTVTVGETHGDHRSNYPYSVVRQLGEGIGYVAGTYTRNSGAVYNWWSAIAAPLGASHISTYPGPSSVVAEMASSAQSALLDKVVKDRDEWDVLTDVSELGQTMSFLKDGVVALKNITLGCLTANPKMVLKAFRVEPTFNRLRHVRNVIKRNRYKLGNTSLAATKSAANLWLAYRYGLMPLLYSCEDAIQVLNASPPKVDRHYQVTFRETFVTRNQVIPQSISGYVTFTEHTTESHSVSVRYKARISYTDSVLARFGLNPWSLPRTVWERVPFSFVVDWFYDVGGWIDRLNLMTVLGSVTGLKTVKDTAHLRRSRDGFAKTVSARDMKIYIDTGREITTETRWFDRTLSSISVQPPSLAWGLNKFKRQVDSIALMLNFIKNPSIKGIPK